jgi:protocatechuate 3,4-dioxygenase beta subunit
MAFASATLATPGLLAEELIKTPPLTEGPFYPDRMPLDTDNDLLVISDKTDLAIGTVTHLTGRILSSSGEPIRNALVEIWQCDNNGAYLHTRSSNAEKRDASFQGYGRFLTDQKGQYYFRTIKPVAYPGRTPHIHYKVTKGNQHLLTTQMLIKGDARNEKDGIFRVIKEAKIRDSLMAEFKAIEKSKIGELTANWDVVLGVTPDERRS